MGFDSHHADFFFFLLLPQDLYDSLYIVIILTLYNGGK